MNLSIFWRVWRPFFILAGFYASVVSATPLIGIGSMYDVLPSNTQSMTKRIYNTGSSTAFVRIDVLEVHPVAEQTPRETVQKELRDHRLEEDRLIVTPLRLIIPPNGFQTVRLLWPGQRNQERYFRIRFVPVMPQLNDGFGLDTQTVERYRQDALQVGMNVLTGYGTLLMVQPDAPHFSTVIQPLTKTIRVHNQGDTTIVLDQIQRCPADMRQCSAPTREFILPGKEAELPQSSGLKTHFTLIEGPSQKTMSY